jgi:hypothetical protein
MHKAMRTTVTLDPDVQALVEKAMREGGLSFNEAVNQAIRSGLTTALPPGFRTPTYRMGTPAARLDRALRLAAELENAELLRKPAPPK